MDRYDHILLEIIRNYRDLENDRKRIKLQTIERNFWKAIESDKELSVGQGRIGERVTRLYISGHIENKDGYFLTRKGKSQLESQFVGEE